MEQKDDSWREAIVNLVVKVSCVLLYLILQMFQFHLYFSLKH